MFKLNLKIAWRNLWKNRGITAINVGGLAIALASFILVMMYFTYETSFDKSVPNRDHIYVVGRTFPDFKTDYTPPPLGDAIKQHFPEVLAVGKMKRGGFEFGISSNKASVFTKRYVMMDYGMAKMFNLKLSTGLVQPNGNEMLFYVNEPFMKTLFPDKENNATESVYFGAKSVGQTGMVMGSVKVDPHSNIDFDAVSIVKEIGVGESYGYPNYFTYIQVKPGTDINLLEQKINKLYQSELLKNGMIEKGEDVNSTTAFLDPLTNQHLQPKAGSDTNYKILLAIATLGLLLLVIACINFTNLSIAQAAKRAKEVGVKKVMGAQRIQLTTQFLLEIFIQCLVATVLGLVIAEIALPQFNGVFFVDLSIWELENGLFWQLPLILILITFIAGFYPSLVLSGFKPAFVLKGNFQTSKQSFWLRNSLLVFQFGVAVIFITGLLVVNAQLKYMRTQDVGFKAEQVVYIKNIVQYDKPKNFDAFREKMMKVPGVKSVTVSDGLPDGSGTGSNSYTFEGKDASLSFVDVDFDYFETLGIQLKAGRFFSLKFGSDLENSAILNEAAVAKYGMTNPIGKTIGGCNTNYTVVGIIKDVKDLGFEKAVEPTIYSINNKCGNSKTQIMVKIDELRMTEVLNTLKSKWSTINPMDGDSFRYAFLDEMYGKLFEKQEQLRSVFFAAAMLTIFIAVLGLFAFAKYITNGRIKEIAVRKILGASNLQIFRLLNSSFFLLVMLANIISWPLAFIVIKKWLETFAYRIDMPILPFVLSAGVTLMLTVVTVTIQARAAVKANPVDALKYE